MIAITTQIAMNNSRFRNPQWYAKSTFDRNLNARASSINPKDTFTVFNHPPDFGSEFNQPGNKAKMAKGTARAKENPNIPTSGPR